MPSADSLVVKGPEGGQVRGELEQLGTVEELRGPDLLLVRLPRRSREPRRAWERVLERLQSAEWVAPVLLDEAREPHFPTGEISVRFQLELEQVELERFAAAHGLRLRRRNEFVPEQAVFAPLEPRRMYLPDTLASLRAADDVAEAWANTLSRYQRA